MCSIYILKGPKAQVSQRLFDLFAGIHDERPVAGDRLVKRFARDQQKAKCMIPPPAVIHCTSPAPMLPALPRVSRWRTAPANI